MTLAQIVVTLGGIAAIVLLTWFFFGPKRAQAARVKGNVQEIEVKVKGGYSPDIIRVRKGVPLRLIFDRQEGGDCTSRVVFPDFRVSKTLPAFASTTLEFTPDKAGEFGFACGMNMIHGRLIVEGEPSEAEAKPAEKGLTYEPAQAVGVGPTMPVEKTEQVEFALMGGGVTCPTCVVNIETALDSLAGIDDVEVNFGAERISISYDPSQISVEKIQQIIENTGYKVSLRSQPGSPETEDREAAERAAERRDLTRRVIIGAILTAPVALVVMAHEFFGAQWVPEILLNRWLQLALITPVMFYTGWPIHRTGWQTLLHRTADMNTLITIGTVAAYTYSLVVTSVPGILPEILRKVYYEAVVFLSKPIGVRLRSVKSSRARYNRLEFLLASKLEV